MPFDKTTAAEMGKIGGIKSAQARVSRKSQSSGRTKQVIVRLTPDESAMVDEKAKNLGLSRNGLFIYAVEQLKQ